MDEQGFWAIIDGTREEASRRSATQRRGLPRRRGGARDLDEHRRVLIASLADLSAEDIRDFDRIWERLYGESYRWELWGAAYVINGGCSDDCFDYFRAYLISLGSRAFEIGLGDPDALVEVVEGPHEVRGDWEALMNPAWEAYERKVGEDIPTGSVGLPAEPLGEAWDEDRVYELYPRLAARFR